MNISTQTQNHRGFTLIELLVVVSIIGLLSSVVLASLSTARQRGITAAQQSQVKQLQIAMQICLSDNGGDFPGTDGVEYCIHGGGGDCVFGDETTFQPPSSLACGSLSFEDIYQDVLVSEYKKNPYMAASFATIANTSSISPRLFSETHSVNGGNIQGLVYVNDTSADLGEFFFGQTGSACQIGGSTPGPNNSVMCATIASGGAADGTDFDELSSS